MIRCEEALERLWEFLDGELEPANETEVQRHLEVCSRCYPRYDFQRAHVELTRGISATDHGRSPRGMVQGNRWCCAIAYAAKPSESTSTIAATRRRSSPSLPALPVAPAASARD